MANNRCWCACAHLKLSWPESTDDLVSYLSTAAKHHSTQTYNACMPMRGSGNQSISSKLLSVQISPYDAC